MWDSFLLVAGKLVLLAPNQVVPLPPSVLMNVAAPMATQKLILAPQKSTSEAPVKQILTTSASNQDSQGKVASVLNTMARNSVGMPLGLATLVTKTTAAATCKISTVVGRPAHSSADNKATKTTCVTVSATPTMTSLAKAVSSMPLLTNSTSAVSFMPLLTSSTTAFPMLSQQSSNNVQRDPASTLVTGTQLGMPSHVTASKNMAATASGPNNSFNNTINTSILNNSAPQHGTPLVNSMTGVVSLGKEQLPTVSTSPSLNVPHVKATNNQINVPSNTALPFLSTVNSKSQPTPVTVSTQVPQSTSRPVLSTFNNIPWSTASQTCTSTHILPQTQTQTVQSTTLQPTNPLFPPTSHLDSTSALGFSSSFTMSDSVVSTAAPLDNSLDICSMADDSTAPTLLSPKSLQSMLQSMLSQSDAQLLWNTMLNSPMIQSPIFKLADTSNSTATTTCTATESYPRTSPLEQFTSQQGCVIAQETEAPQQNNDMIPESIQDAFSDLNVQGVTEQDRFAEEVIFSTMLSSRAKGSGYGLGIDIEELLDNAGIVQDPALANL